MRKHNFLKAVAMTLAMALLVSGTAFAATPGQALDGKEVKYGTVSSADARVLRTMFDAEYYAKEHEDVAKIVGKNANALFNHFLKYGIFEGRAASKDFNVSAYKSSYGDLQKAFKDDIISYYLHYAKFGKAEKRELITVEKAEAAGVTIQSVVPGATKTVLTPKQEAAKSSSSSSSSGSEVHAPITSDVYYFNGTNIVGLTQAEYDEIVASAEDEEVEMLSDTFYSMTVHYRADNATAWTDYKAAEIERNANVEADMAVLGAISVNAPNGANEATVLGLINDEISGLSSLNFTDWTASEIISGYTATTAGSQSVSVLFDTTAGSSRVPATVTVVVAEAEGEEEPTEVTDSDISTTNKTLSLTAGYTTGNTVSIAANAVTDVAFTYDETTDTGDCFSIDADGLVTFATGKTAETYTATFTITATGSDTRTGSATKDVTVTVTVAAAEPTAVTDSDISTTDKSLSLTVDNTTGNTVSIAADAVTDVEFAYEEATDEANCFSIDDDGLVTFATGQEAATYTATFTITATGSDTRTGTATKTVTVTVTVAN